MFKPSALRASVANAADDREKVSALITGVIGQLRDVIHDERQLSRYLAELEWEIPRLQDAFAPLPVVQPAPETLALPLAAPHPLDHDGDGHPGGSLSGEQSTAARGKRNRENSK